MSDDLIRDLGEDGSDSLATEQLLAAAVVRQAFADLSTVRRESCRRFLFVDLWQPGNLWGALIADSLVRRQVTAEADRRCKTPIGVSTSRWNELRRQRAEISASDREARDQRFVEAWERNDTMEQLMVEFKIHSSKAVSVYASQLRKKGLPLEPRRMKPVAKTFSEVKAGGGLNLINASPAAIYDGAGRLVGVMDPLTRARRQLRKLKHVDAVVESQRWPSDVGDGRANGTGRGMGCPPAVSAAAHNAVRSRS